MKNFLIDLILVVLILIIGTTFFSKDSLRQNNFEQSLETFEERVQNEEVLESVYYHSKLEKTNKENNISKTTRFLSDTTVDGIKVVVEIFGEVISVIFN
jgi:hypothetical protein